MENSNSEIPKCNVLVPEPVDEPVADPLAEPKKPTLIQKLKEKRWTFKLKNNLTQYVTVEPLICFYMLQIFVVSLIEPYHFHKACSSLDQDVYFCNVMTINDHYIYQPCAEYDEITTVHCKGLSKKPDIISCNSVIEKYNENLTKVFVKPEDFRFCDVIEKAAAKYNKNTDSLIGISAMMISFLVVMIVSIWSDKYSKRKICLILPIIGQLLTSILNLHGALSNFFSFEFINNSNLFINALTGGTTLFLFGCFTYMNDETIRRKLLFRFGIICLALTIYRYIPQLYWQVYQYYRDDDSYLDLIIINLVFNIVCLLYVKIILNESKHPVTTVTESMHSLRSVNNSDVLSVGKISTARKHAKRKQLAKAFSLDVVWDYIQIIFKRRNHSARLIILLYLAVVLVDKMSPYDVRLTLRFNEYISVYSIDIDAAIFVIISITMLLRRISDMLITVLVIGIPTATRQAMAIMSNYYDYVLEVDSAATDFYTPFKRIASCTFLLAHVNNSESRIFLIVQLIAQLPSVVSIILKDSEIYSKIRESEELFEFVMLMVLPVLVFCGLGFLYYIDRKLKNLRKKEYFKFTNQSKNGKEQIVVPAPPAFVDGHEDFSTHL